MKVLLLGATFFLFLGANAYAATLDWTRNGEADVNHYNIFTCPTEGCTVTISPFVPNTPRTAVSPTVKSTVVVTQPAVGAIPTATVTVGVGGVAVTAVDNANNESGLSNQACLPTALHDGNCFPIVSDQTAPAAPSNLKAR